MSRVPDWEARLAEYLESVRETPFAWGSHDCALFAASAVEAMTGVDYGAPFRGKYRTELGSVRALKRFGAGSLEATLDGLFPEIPLAFAQRGDVVMRDEAAGICLGPDAAFVGDLDGAPGLVRYPRREWARAWRVG